MLQILLYKNVIEIFKNKAHLRNKKIFLLPGYNGYKDFV